MAWMAWVVASVFYAYQYILRVMPNIMLSDIMQQFHIDAATFGQFAGVYYIGYSLMHLPIGILLDRVGPRKVMSVCALLTVVGLAPLVFSENWIYLIIGRFLIGVGSSAAILGVFKIIRMTFKEKQFSRMLGISVMIGLIGAIYGGGPVNYLAQAFGYQKVVCLLGLIGILLALIAYWIVPNMPTVSKGNVLAHVKEVIGNPKVIWICLFAGLMVGPLEGFADVWGTVFLTKFYGLSGAVAASLPSMIFVGMCFGSPGLSLIAEKTRSYLLTIVGAGFLMAVGFILLLRGSLNQGVLSINFIITGVCCAYQILAIYKASTYVREERAGLTTAVANMIIMIFGYAFHATMGGVVDGLGGPDVPQALFYGVAVIPAALSLGVVGFFSLWLQERRNRVRT